MNIQRNGFSTFKSLVVDLVGILKANGFDVVNVDGTATDSIADINSKVCMNATSIVDPIVSNQPWSLSLFYDEQEQWLDFYITGRDQVIDIDGDFRIAVRRAVDETDYLSGKLTKDSLNRISSEAGSSRTVSFENWDILGSDTQANPMSYQVSFHPHGFTLSIWVESYDNAGDKFFWLCCQRMVTKSGSVVTKGKSPLFCVFSTRGLAASRTNDIDDIYQFVVREKDVNAPTFPVSATTDTADSNRIINSKQQVSIREDDTIVMTFPNGLCTQRYGYIHQLDLIGIISADVLSQSIELEVNPFNEATARKYVGMNAQQPFNKGMRVMFWTEGGE